MATLFTYLVEKSVWQLSNIIWSETVKTSLTRRIQWLELNLSVSRLIKNHVTGHLIAIKRSISAVSLNTGNKIDLPAYRAYRKRKTTTKSR